MKLLLFLSILFSCFCSQGSQRIKDAADTIEVHLIPHSHNDVGWLKTVDEYYRGYRPEIQSANVRKILYSILEDLSSLNNHTFVYAEMAFFSKWYDSLDHASSLAVKKLLSRGKFEFVNAGWVMNDEASSDYTDIINQMSLGRRYILSKFGKDHLPKTGWQIDPFGHSQTMASIFQAMGYETVFLGRISESMRNLLRVTQQSHFLWNIDESMIPAEYLTRSSSIDTILLPNNYSPPPGFCFDSECGDDQLIDDPTMPNYNLNAKCWQFSEYARLYSSYYSTMYNIAPMTMGNDFNYQVASKWFANIDKMIKYFGKSNEYINLTMRYSSPSRFADAVKTASKDDDNLYGHKGDFFPYNDGPRSFWSGFYSSRPSLKAYIRETSWLYSVASQLSFFLPFVSESTLQLAEAVSVAQHHDAITGTAKQHVVDDYVKMLFDARDKMMVHAIPSGMNDHFKTIQDPFYCNYLNVSFCPALNHQNDYHIFMYNPHGKSHEFCLKVPVQNPSYGIFLPDGTKILSEILPANHSSYKPEYFKYDLKYSLFFCIHLPYTKFTTVHIKPVSDKRAQPSEDASFAQLNKLTSNYEKVIVMTTKIETDFYIIRLDALTKTLKSIVSKSDKNPQEFKINLGYYYYTSVAGDSGAYVFRPKEETVHPRKEPNPCSHIKSVKSKVFRTNSGLITEIWTTHGDFCHQIMRIWKNSPFIEIEYTVGPLPIHTNDINKHLPDGMELIFRLDSDVNSGKSFYTDSNGRQFMKRELNDDIEAPISSNYYPITRYASIREAAADGRSILMVSDRSVGTSSLKNGSLEVMLHRRMNADDHRGMEEALNENDEKLKYPSVTKGKIWLSFGTVEQNTKLAYRDARYLQSPPLMMFSDYAGVDILINNTGFNMSHGHFPHKLLSKELPDQIRIFSFEILPQDPNSLKKLMVLIRLEHEFYSKDSELVDAFPVSVRLDSLLDLKFSVHGTLNLDCITEMYLAGDVPLDKSRNKSKDRESQDQKCISVTEIRPGQIRTFLYVYKIESE